MASHPLPLPEPALNFSTTPSAIEAECRKLIEERLQLVKQLLDQPRELQSFERVILPFIDNENLYLRRRRQLNFYASTHPEEDIKEASRTASKCFADADIELFARDDFCRTVEAIHQTQENIEPEYRYFLENMLMTFEKNGLSILDKGERARFKEVQRTIGDLESDILTNLNRDQSGDWFSRDQLEGVRDSFFEDRESKLDNDSGTIQYWVTTKDPDKVAIAEHAVHDETRKKHWLVFENKCPENAQLYQKLISSRDEAARLLGFGNHAQFKTKYQMAKSPETVNQFLENIEQGLRERRKPDLSSWLTAKKQYLEGKGLLNDHPDTIFLWESSFYERMHGDKTHQINSTNIAEYYSLENTMKELFKLFEHLFGVRIQETKPSKDEIWHEDVSLYAVFDMDNGSAFLGWLYVDPFPRAGKYTHFGHYSLQPGRITRSEETLYPAAALVANFPRPSASTPSLLSYDTVRRVFHELGHCMHNLLSTTLCARFHGPSSGHRDYSEAVSIMFEKFLWLPRHMRACSLHYSYLTPEYGHAWDKAHPGMERPPRQLDEKIIDKIIATRSDGLVSSTLANIAYSKFDMRIHSPSTASEAANMDMAQLYNSIRVATLGTQGPPGAGYKWAPGFTRLRLIAGGYDAYYYSYVIAQVYACDLFARGFESDSMSQKEGRRYRKMVLEPGGSQHPLDILRAYLGREPRDDAFRREIGLTN